jgi:N-acetylmuramoyl-L-alanine amidase
VRSLEDPNSGGMWLNVTPKARSVAISVLLAVITLLFRPDVAVAELPTVKVIYPKPGQVVTAVDSTFILGHVVGVDDLDKYRLRINGHEVPLHEGGGFIAFLPVTPGDFSFDLTLYSPESERSSRPSRAISPTLSVPVQIPQPLKSLPLTKLEIAGDYRAPRGDRVLLAGDRLDVMFRGTPGLAAWFSINGVVDSVPMAETSPRPQPYWGESVFGAGAIPESVLVKGIYSGFYEIPDTIVVTNASITYHLAPPDAAGIVARLMTGPVDTTIFTWLRYLVLGGEEITAQSSYRVSFNPPEYPFAVRFTDSVQTIRYGPRKGYFSIFQPEGVIAMAVGAEADWYKVKLSSTQYAWAHKQSVERLPKGILPPSSYVTSIRTYSSDSDLSVEIPLTGKHPFRVIEDDPRTVRLQLFGVTSNTDWIRYDFSDELVDIATWSQPEPDLYELQFKLTRAMWGFDVYYLGNTLYFVINRIPAKVREFKHKRIIIDPGHSADPGAIGPTGLTEAEANLAISLELADRLRKKGAEVVLTREDNRDVPLYDRPAIAKLNGADLFISIHNNALPDGVNPFENNGVSTYYYHPHSIKLARSIQKEMIKATGLRDHGLFHGNLAVNRPTQYPAVLVECAFIILPEQEALLKTENFRKRVARAIVKGIENFLKDYDRD